MSNSTVFTSGVTITSGWLNDVNNFVFNGSGVAGVSSFNTRTGAVVLGPSDVTGALGYVPAGINSPNFTGSPTVPLASPGTNNGVVASTAFVAAAIAPLSGTVTNVSVATANGLAGTVATASTTPVITLSSPVNGIVQGNGTTLSALTVGTGLSYAGGVLTATGGGGGGGTPQAIVTSIAGLRSIAHTSYSYVQVTGYTSSGDGGGGLYWYNASDTTTADNGGTVIVASDGGRWYLEYADSVSADQFGIDNTGATDAQPKLQTFINWCQTNKVLPTLHPQGKYRLNSSLVFKQGMSSTDTINWLPQLDGKEATFFPYGAIVGLDVQPQCLAVDYASSREDQTISFSNFIIDLTHMTAGGIGWRMGRLNYAMYCNSFGKVDNVKVINSANTAGLTGTWLQDVAHITFTRFVHKYRSTLVITSQNTSGLTFAGDMIFDGCQFDGDWNTPCFNIYSGVTGSSVINQVRGIKFFGTDFYNAGSALSAYGNNSQVGDIFFSNCQWDGNGATDGQTVLRLYAHDTAHIFQVHISDSYCVGFYAPWVDANCNTGATLEMCDLIGGAANDMACSISQGSSIVNLSGVQGFVVSGVQFANVVPGTATTSQLVNVFNSTNVSITDNVLTRASTLNYGVTLSGTSNKFVVSDNNFSTVATAPVNNIASGSPVYVINSNLGAGGTTGSFSALTVTGQSTLGQINNIGTGAANGLLQAVSGGSTFVPMYVTGSQFILAAGSTSSPSEIFRTVGLQTGWGTVSPGSGTLIDFQSTTGGVRFPNMTTSQKNAITAPAEGTTVYDTTLHALCEYNGTAWQTLSTGGSGTVTNIATGTGLSGGPITSTGTISLANTAVSAGSYGNGSTVATFTVDAQGRLTSAGNTSISISTGQVSGLGSMATQNSSAISGTGTSTFQTVRSTNGGWESYNGSSYVGNFTTAAYHVWAGGSTSSPSEGMRTDSNNYLLIGYLTSNGSYRLQVNSQIFATSSTIATSDARYKENVKPIIGALDLVTKLNPVTFKWKKHDVHNFPEGTTTGFLAQEVQEVLKDTSYVDSIIKKNSCTLKDETQEEFLGIAEGNMISILTAAIKELKAEIDILKQKG